ncbi:hypothetical protein HPB47_013229, partial [Ixodes persulcatus]
TYGANPGVLYVDAAEYRHQGIFTAAVTDNLHSPIDAVTLLTTDPETAEEVYPPADKSLILEQAYSWRQLQTGTFPNPATLTHIFHSMYPTSECPLCGDKATLPHRIWPCPENPIPPIPSHDEWEASLRSSDPEVQRALVERAMEVVTTTATTRTAL